ncbi:MAG: ATP-binding protein [Prevotella sp.]|jgi:ABC-type cobalamin/Fe3+-siderophores transport system ATPase subunit|nr:ATP-binding protein [Prevotella sp.]MCI1781714.1 ATP-binding protein [Prevotella sp.]MCI1802670.1 ATP-binding protein [Prevotella sp.]MCI1817485.1 ATP-binding protein [Prevotella sp.]MCI1848609.1 ATP-binding protein [Prevotella sp.]
MKPIVSIHHLGPLKDVEVEINKYNVFIGPQSSGKSTLAKVISFCQWLEKDVLIKQGKDHIDTKYIDKNLIKYHKLDSYIYDDTQIKFKGNLLQILFDGKSHNCQVDIVGDLKKAKMGKISYIPSERNYVAIPNLSTLKMADTYVRDFVFDWLLIRSKFDVKNQIDLLGLGIKYYYDASKGDVIVLPDGKTIDMDQASSGIQSAVPMYAFLNYNTKWVFENEQDISFDKYTAIRNLADQTFFSDKEIADLMKRESLKNDKIFSDLINIIITLKDKSGLKDSVVRIADLTERIGKPHYSNLIIEEPEENLFPETQYYLIKEIAQMIDNKRDNTIVITTHSPYVMTTINNLIAAGDIVSHDESKKDAVENILHCSSYIRYEDLSAYGIKDGKIHSIKDDEFQLISTDELDKASECISDDYSKLLEL